MKRLMKLTAVIAIVIACIVSTQTDAQAKTKKSDKFIWSTKIRVIDEKGKPAKATVTINGKKKTVKGNYMIKKSGRKMPCVKIKCKKAKDKKAISSAYVKNGKTHISSVYTFIVKAKTKSKEKGRNITGTVSADPASNDFVPETVKDENKDDDDYEDYDDNDEDDDDEDGEELSAVFESDQTPVTGIQTYPEMGSQDIFTTTYYEYVEYKGIQIKIRVETKRIVMNDGTEYTWTKKYAEDYGDILVGSGSSITSDLTATSDTNIDFSWLDNSIAVYPGDEDEDS